MTATGDNWRGDERHSLIVHVIDRDDATRKHTASLLSTGRYAVKFWPSAQIFLATLAEADQGCVIFDPGEEGLLADELQSMLASTEVGMPAIVVCGNTCLEAATQAMRRGAIDVIMKPVNAARLYEALAIAETRLDKSRRRAATLKRVQAVLNLLTDRERDVLADLTRGFSNKEIGRRLAISSRTVEIHRSNLMRKLDASSLSQALRIAFIAEVCGEVNPALHVQ